MTEKKKNIRREEHFKSGGSVEEWLGFHKIQKSKNQRRQNRRTKKQKAIKEGLDSDE